VGTAAQLSDLSAYGWASVQRRSVDRRAGQAPAARGRAQLSRVAGGHRGRRAGLDDRPQARALTRRWQAIGIGRCRVERDQFVVDGQDLVPVLCGGVFADLPLQLLEPAPLRAATAC
jgi:hypothetical protein